MAASAAAVGRGIRLRAEDADDLAVISACLQDALVAVRDLAYDREDRTFMLVANRFRWENRVDSAGDEAALERVLCGVGFSDVDAVAYRGFRRAEEDRILALLSVRAEAATPGVVLRLDFSGGAEIRLSAAQIRCRLKDLGEPWPTAWQPDHPADEPA